MIEPALPSTQLTETAQVIKTEPGYAWVEVKRKNSCGSCHSTGSCGTEVLGDVLPGKTILLKVENTINAQVGEEVLLTLPAINIVISSIVSYFLPLFTMLLALMMVTLFFKESTNIIAIILSMIGLSVGFFLVLIINQLFKKNPNYHPKIQALFKVKL